MFPSALVQRYTRIAAENMEFQQGMIRLTATVGGKFEDVADAFKNWCMTTPFPWQVALGYCLDRAREGKSLPFTTQ